jgi:hypothetical protein
MLTAKLLINHSPFFVDLQQLDFSTPHWMLEKSYATFEFYFMVIGDILLAISEWKSPLQGLRKLELERILELSSK